MNKKYISALAAIAAAILSHTVFPAGASAMPVLDDERLPAILDSLRSRYSFYSRWCSPEKVYLHMPRTYYAAGETMWFSAYVSNASPEARFPVSKFVYVEVMDSRQEVVRRVKLRRTDDAFQGSIEIPEYLTTGEYTVRSYTLWQMNNSPEYMFNQRIHILGGDKTSPKKSEAPSDKVNVTFYPEGGRYFAGVSARMGFKALNPKGQSVDISGWIKDESGESIVYVCTAHDGMGAFRFKAEEGKNYYLESREGARYPLPAVSTEGVSVSVSSFRKFVYLQVSGIPGATYTVFIRNISSMIPLSRFTLSSNQMSFKVDENDFDRGLNTVVLMKDDGSIASERLFYVGDPLLDVPVCRFRIDSCQHKARSLVKGVLAVTDSLGRPVEGRFSVSVVKAGFKRFQQNNGIVSYMNLSSELRGNINNPDYYFDPSVSAVSRKSKLDLLLMIQGWSYYDMSQFSRLDGAKFKIRHFKEYVQTITGHIKRLLSSRIPKRYLFSLIIPSQHFTVFKDVEKADRFIIDSLSFAENTAFFIKIDRPEGLVSYIPKWDGDPVPQPCRYQPSPGYAAVGTSKVIEEEPFAYDIARRDTLQAAVVTASRDPFEGGFMGRSVNPDDFSAFGNYTLVEYLSVTKPAFEYDGENMVNRRNARAGSFSQSSDEEDGESMGTESFGEESTPGGSVVKLVVAGSEEPWWAYENVHMDEVSALGVSTQPDPMFGSNSGVVMLKLKEGVRVEAPGSRQLSLLYFVPLGYQKPTYFYSPRYDKGAPSDGFDHRNTIYWNPACVTRGGKYQLCFCDTDQMEYPYILKIEGQTLSGQPFSFHSVIE